MEPDITTRDVAANQAILLGGTNSFPPISQLPTELLIAILQLSLPEIHLRSRYAALNLGFRMKRLYTMRAVTKRWQQVIDGTPSFWTIIVSTLPLHVNEKSILRSSDLPLSLIYDDTRLVGPPNHPSDTFFKLVQHSRLRWAALAMSLDDPGILSDYVAATLPLLHTIILRISRPHGFHSEPRELLGGHTTNLRVVYLEGVSSPWLVGSFVQLKSLTLKNLAHATLTGGQLLDAIRASPGLQVLKLSGMTTVIPPPSRTITLHHLRYISLVSCATDLVECIFRQVRAPSCTRLRLSIGYEQEIDAPRFLNETLKPFHHILSSIHRRLGGSVVPLDTGGFEWYTPDYSELDGFLILIHCMLDPSCISWIDSILQDEPGLRVYFEHDFPSSDDLLRSVAPMRSVTKVDITDIPGEKDIHEALQFIGKSLPTSTSLPSLPNLRELLLPWRGWTTRELLDMVQSRFSASLWQDKECTPLTINAQRGGLHNRRSILDLATIVQVRSTRGVQCVELVGLKDPVGMLAVVWDEEGSEPVWA